MIAASTPSPRRRPAPGLSAALVALAALAAGPAAADDAPPPAAAPLNTAPAPAAPPPGSLPLTMVVRPRGPAGAEAVLPSESAARLKLKIRLLVAGSVVFGIGYMSALVVSSAGISRQGANSREYIPGLFPLAGPFITAGMRAEPNRPSFPGQVTDPDNAGMALYMALGIVQLVGAGVLAGGVWAPSGRALDRCSEQGSSAPPCPPVRLSFAPVVLPGFAGAGVSGAF